MMTKFTVHTKRIPARFLEAKRRQLVLVGSLAHVPLPMNATADHWI